MGFEGYVRVLGASGAVLDLAEASLGPIEHVGHDWGGRLLVSAGSGLTGKRLPVHLDLPGQFNVEALLCPTGESADAGRVVLEVLGEGPAPFD